MLVLVRVIGLVIDFPVVLGSRESIMRQSMETIRSSSAFPSAASFASIRLRATRVSRHAAHSRAEPRAISRKRRRSASDRLHPFGYHEARPFPSAMLFEIDTLASSRCLVALVRLFFNEPSSRSPTHALILPPRGTHRLSSSVGQEPTELPIANEHDSETETEHEHDQVFANRDLDAAGCFRHWT